MATSREASVDLVIRARNEADRAINAVAGALNGLLGSQNDVARSGKAVDSTLGDLVKTAAALDKAYATVSGGADKAQRAFTQQEASIASNRKELAALQAQAENAGKAIARLQSPNAVVSAGRNQAPRLAQIKEAAASQSALEGQAARLAATIARQETALNNSRSAMQQLGSSTIAIEQAQAKARSEIEATTAAIEKQNRATLLQGQASQVAPRVNFTTGVTRPAATANGATTDAFIADGQRLQAAAAAIRAAIDPVSVITARYAAAQRDANDAQEAGLITSSELQKRIAQLGASQKAEIDGLTRARANAPKVSLLGLAPYETQNLLYQVNDVITQLSSGAHFSQVLAQQGGQIFQLFQNRIGPSIAAAFSNPVFLGAAATIGVIALAVKRLADEQERVRELSASLSGNVDGGIYDPQKLEASIEKLHAYGIAIDDASAAIKVFVNAGIAPDKLDTFTRIANDLAAAKGIKVPDAASKLAAGFDGSYASLKKLDDEYNLFSAQQRRAIKDAFDQGNSQKGLQLALVDLQQQFDEIAKKQKGEWAQSAQAAGSSFSSLIDALARTGAVKGVAGILNDTARAVTNLLNSFTGGRTLANVRNDISATLADIAGVKANGSDSAHGDIGARMDFLQKKLAALRVEEQAFIDAQKRAIPSGDVRNSNSQAQQKADRDLQQATQQLAADTAKRGDAEYHITTQKERQLVLTQAELKARAEAEQKSPGASDAAKNAYVAQARRAAAADLDRSDEAALKAIIAQFVPRVIDAEGSGKNKAGSKAAGFGQFMPDTYLSLYKQTYGDLGQTRDQILDTRNDKTIATGVVETLTRQNAAFLGRIGAQINATNLYIAHFLGQAGAAKFLAASGDTPVDQVGLSRGAISQNAGVMRNGGGKGSVRTVDQVRAELARRIGDTGPGAAAGTAAIIANDEAQRQRQEDLTLAVKQENDERTRTITALTAERGLIDDNLIAAQRAAAVTKAEADLKKKFEDSNKGKKPGEADIEVTKEQIAQTRALAAAEFDAQHAREVTQAKAAAARRPVDDLVAQKEAMQAQAEFLRSIGDNAGADQLTAQVEGLNDKLRDAYDTLIAFYEKLSPDEQKDLRILDPQQLADTVAQLHNAKDASQEWGTVMGVNAQEIARAFASSAVNSIDQFLEKVAAGKNVFKSLADSVRSFAASFIQSIAQMILQLLAYAAAVSILRALGVPVPATTVGVHHGGGVTGAPGTTRNVSPMWFAAATRYHTGGIAGLKPNEVPAILQRGEEVLTANDPRHRNNGGGASGGAGNLTVIPVFDPADVLEKALSRPAGEKVLMAHFRDNAEAYRSALG